MVIVLLILWVLIGILNFLQIKRNKDDRYWKIQWTLIWVVLIVQLLEKFEV